MALNVYISQTQRLLHDPQAQYFSIADITVYINIARSQIAIESQSIRVLISGIVSACPVVVGGANYSAGTTISIAGGSGGTGAVYQPTIVGGQITATTQIALGSGYDNLTKAIAVDPTGAGSGAVFAPVVVGLNMMVIGQEVYTFASRNAALQVVTSGQCSAIHGVFSVSCSWGSSKPTLTHTSWGYFQANYRVWANGWLNNPVAWAQYGQGASGSIYLAPIPSSAFSMDWDTYCVPTALNSDTDGEALPYPWTDAVPYYAAYLAYSNAQRPNDATAMLNQYKMYMMRARAFSEPPFIPDPYSE